MRDLYPSTNKYARRGLGNLTGAIPLPAEPTSAPPGSLEKMKVMRRRIERGEGLFHPRDNPEVDRALIDPFPQVGNGRRAHEDTGLEEAA